MDKLKSTLTLKKILTKILLVHKEYFFKKISIFNIKISQRFFLKKLNASNNFIGDRHNYDIIKNIIKKRLLFNKIEIPLTIKIPVQINKF